MSGDILISPRQMVTLFIHWSNVKLSIIDELRELQDVLREKYASEIEVLQLDHTASQASVEEDLFYTIDTILRRNDNTENLLCIIYSGNCIIRDRHLFLRANDTRSDSSTLEMEWSGGMFSLDHKLLQASVPVYIIFDIRWRFSSTDLDRIWEGMTLRIDEVRRSRLFPNRGPELSILISYDSDESTLHPLKQALESLPVHHTKGFTDSVLRQFLNFGGTTRYASFARELDTVNFLPITWPRLQLYDHIDFDDPFDKYFNRATIIHDEGQCKVVYMSLDNYQQNFPFANGRSCLVAIKRFTARGRRQRLLMKEAFMAERENLLQIAQWDYERIMNMICSFEIRTPKSNTMNIVFDYASGGDLWNFLRLDQALVGTKMGKSKGYPSSDFSGPLADWKYAVFREMVGLAEVLSFLHDKDRGTFVIHRDIKPSNILIHRGKFKLSDFGLSRLKGSEDTSKTDWMLGSLMYAPPEKESDMMGRARDIWALGCVFLEIAVMIKSEMDSTTHKGEAVNTNAIELFEKERRASSKAAGIVETAMYCKTMNCVNTVLNELENLMPSTLEKAIVSEALVSVIRSMLETDATKRITAKTATSDLRAGYESMQRDSRFLDESGGVEGLETSISSMPRLIFTPMGTRFSLARTDSEQSNIQLQSNETGSLGEELSQSNSDDTFEDSAGEEGSFRFRKRKRQN